MDPPSSSSLSYYPSNFQEDGTFEGNLEFADRYLIPQEPVKPTKPKTGKQPSLLVAKHKAKQDRPSSAADKARFRESRTFVHVPICESCRDASTLEKSVLRIPLCDSCRLRNKKWTTGTSSIFLWISVPILSGFVYVFAIHYFWQLSEVMDAFVRAALEKLEEVSKSQLIYFSSYAFKTIPKSEVIELDWLQIYGVIFLCSSVSLSFFTMIYFGLKTYSAMRKFREATSTDSASSKNLQTQLFYSLVIQTIIPVILIHFPTTLIYISTFFDAAYPVYGKIVTVTISLFPAIDPLPSLLIIGPYRRAIRGCFMKNFGLKRGISVEPSNRGTSTIYSSRTAQF
ncbi:hypothetical protein GCK72_020465 [Caenorhabditis remanei]|uniref:G protein-coupled receptor n=1 Tax=Caenorhabditis remanei TaxID=31234 RepID=A0A6A5GFD2_CAERE|nr:hypothetical protein GCK72_020465 [Caenorhabditis remanei]KAF1753908.1 hypothetical protein GCK72_020465 [Caenorhabditis remanei]